MGLRFWLFVLATAELAHSIHCLADREIYDGVDRLSGAKLMHLDGLSSEPKLSMVSAQSPYTREER